ncbi:hypothetical protein PSTT_07101, partial [Puccinia striiformis]
SHWLTCHPPGIFQVPPHLQRDLRDQRNLCDLLTPTPGAGLNPLTSSLNTGVNLSIYDNNFEPAGNSHTANLGTTRRYESMGLSYNHPGQTNSSNESMGLSHKPCGQTHSSNGNKEDHHKGAALVVEVNHNDYNDCSTYWTPNLQILGMNQQNIMGALVYGLLAYQPAPATVAPVPEGAPVVVYICNFLFSDYIKEDDIKDFTCHTLMEGRLVGYSCTTNGDGAPQVHSLLNMTPARIAGLPLHIKTQNLPPGYTTNSPTPPHSE